MKEYRTMKVDIATYSKFLSFARRSIILDVSSLAFIGVLILLIKPIEIIKTSTSTWVLTTSTNPFYGSFTLYLVAVTILLMGYFRLLKADLKKVFPYYRYVKKRQIYEPVIDFTDQPDLIEIIEPLGTYSNNWLIFFIVGVWVSLIATLFGLTSAILGLVSAISKVIILESTVQAFDSVFIVSIISIYLQCILLITLVRASLFSFSIFKHSLELSWPRNLQEALTWTIHRSKLISKNGCSSSWIERIKTVLYMPYLSGTFNLLVNASRSETFDVITKYLMSKNIQIKTVREPDLIIAEHGKLFALEPKNTKKIIQITLRQESHEKSTVSVLLKFSKLDMLSDCISLLTLAVILILLYRLDAAYKTHLTILSLLLVTSMFLWDFLEKDAIIRDLYLHLRSKGLVEFFDTVKEEKLLSPIINFMRNVVDSLDNLLRILFGEGLLKPEDFPKPSVYFYRDYRSSLNKYGKMKEEQPFGKENESIDLGPASSRKASEIQIKVRNEDRCDIYYRGKMIRQDLVNPLKLFEKIKIIGTPTSRIPHGPWASFLIIGESLLLFFVSLNSYDYVITKWNFVLVLTLGLWVMCSTIISLMFNTFSELFYLPEIIKWITTFLILPFIVITLNLLLPEGYYSLKVGIYSLAASGLLFGLLITPHTSGKPYSRAIYYYDPDPVSPYFPYKYVNDAPFWLNKNSPYWVFRFVLQWLWEISLPPKRDYERLEIWINAYDGHVEWIVTDFHYRELWYEAHGLEKIIVLWDDNFHTFHPITIEENLMFNEEMSNVINHLKREALLKKKLRDLYNIYGQLHTTDKVKKYFHGLERLSASSCAKLPWKYWRYSHGAYPRERSLSHWRRYAHYERCEGHGAALREEQFL
ncbi:MAG: hypothetical protein QXL77_03935 [Candidatus Bathyarchaeia archaeon]